VPQYFGVNAAQSLRAVLHISPERAHQFIAGLLRPFEASAHHTLHAEDGMFNSP